MILTEDSVKMMFKIAYKSASVSPDTRTQVGVVLVSKKNLMIPACNEPSPGFTIDSDEYRNNKYAIMEHAERSAIFAAHKKNIPTDGSILFSPWSSCADCSRAIVLSGVTKVIRHKEIVEQSFPRWTESIRIGNKILIDGGVDIIEYSFKNIGAAPILMDGKEWNA